MPPKIMVTNSQSQSQCQSQSQVDQQQPDAEPSPDRPDAKRRKLDEEDGPVEPDPENFPDEWPVWDLLQLLDEMVHWVG